MELKINNPKYYVGVQTRGEDKDYHLTLITEVDNIKKTWKAEADKKPYVFASRKLAEEMVVCLALNMTFAVVVYGQYDITGQPFVDHREDK